MRINMWRAIAGLASTGLLAVVALLVCGFQSTYPAPGAGRQSYAAGTSCGSPPFTDSFTGSGSLGSCYTALAMGSYGPLAKSSGTATCASSGGCISVITGVTFPANQYFEAAPASSLLGGYAYWCIEMNTAGNGVCFFSDQFSAGINAIYTLVGGSLTTSLASCSTPGAGDTIKISNVGTAVTVTDVTASTTLCTGTYSGTGSPAFGLFNTTGSFGPITAD